MAAPPTEPLITWNLFLTAGIVPLSVMILYGAIVRQFKERDKKDDEIKKLQDEKDKLRQANLTEWRERFAASQCGIKDKLEEIDDKLNDKVSWKDCRDREAELTRKLERLDDQIRLVTP